MRCPCAASTTKRRSYMYVVEERRRKWIDRQFSNNFIDICQIKMVQDLKEKVRKQAAVLARVAVLSVKEPPRGREWDWAEDVALAVEPDRAEDRVADAEMLNMCPRPRGHRRIGFSPEATFFKPQGIPMRSLEVVELSKEELEAFRLTQYEGMNQIEAAQKMQTSQSTLQRILTGALAKVAEALVEGKAIRIERDE